MTKRPIEQSNDPDLIGSVKAMKRAAVKAREIAKQTNTEVVVSIDKKLVYYKPNDPADPLSELNRSS